MVEAVVVLFLAFFDAEAGFNTPKLMPYHVDEPTQGISGVTGWLAGHNFAQLFFKDRRNWLCFGGVNVLLSYTYSWITGTKGIAHARHFQTLGAGVLSALAMRYGLKRKDPVRYLRDRSGVLTIVIVGFGIILNLLSKKLWPVDDVQGKQEEV